MLKTRGIEKIYIYFLRIVKKTHLIINEAKVKSYYLGDFGNEKILKNYFM